MLEIELLMKDSPAIQIDMIPILHDMICWQIFRNIVTMVELMLHYHIVLKMQRSSSARKNGLHFGVRTVLQIMLLVMWWTLSKDVTWRRAVAMASLGVTAQKTYWAMLYSGALELAKREERFLLHVEGHSTSSPFQ